MDGRKAFQGHRGLLGHLMGTTCVDLQAADDLTATAVLSVSLSFLLLHGLFDVSLVSMTCRCERFGFVWVVDFRRLERYTPSATVVRLLTTNILIAYVSSWVLFLSGAALDPRMLLPAWISIATVSELSSQSAPGLSNTFASDIFGSTRSNFL